jgi:hypothetical protein
MRSSQFRTVLLSSQVFALALLVCSRSVVAQDDGGTRRSKLQFSVTSQLPKRPKVGKDVLTVLKEAGTYSTFLKLADRAGLTPILHGTARDSASADVTLQDAATPQISSTDIHFGGQLPMGVDPEAAKSGIMELLSGAMVQATKQAALHSGEITVFAPTDAAFKALSKATQDSLQSNPDLLRTLLRGHVVNTGIDELVLKGAVRNMNTLSGTQLSVTPVTAALPKIAGATIVQSTYGDNGVIYGLDTVLRR